MAKYYYEYNEELQEIDIPAKSLATFKASNPHLTVKRASEVGATKLTERESRLAKADVHAKRKAEYPPIADQLDAIMKWAFTEKEIGLPAELVSLAGKCMSVKSKHPLP